MLSFKIGLIHITALLSCMYSRTELSNTLYGILIESALGRKLHLYNMMCSTKIFFSPFIEVFVIDLK